MTPRRILNLLRSLFLVTSLLCAGITLFWPQVYSQLSKADWVMVKLHTRKHQEGFDAAQELVKSGDRVGAISKLAGLAEGLRGVRRGDRLDELRTETLDRVADLQQKEGNFAESLKWTDELLEYDPRDFIAMKRRADLLTAMGDTEAALAQLEAAFKVGSVSGALQLSYMDALVERGDREGLAETLLALGNRGPLAISTSGWEFRWAEDAKYSFKDRMNLPIERVGDSSLYRASISNPGGAWTARSVRVDMPPGSLLAMAGIECTMRRSDGTTARFTESDMSHIHHITEVGASWLPTGDNDPYFMLQPENIEAVTGIVGFDVVLDLKPTLPQKALALLEGPFDPALRARWVKRFGDELVTALESLHG